MRDVIIDKNAAELADYERELWRSYYNVPLRTVDDGRRVGILIFLIGVVRTRRKEIAAHERLQATH